MRLDDYLRRKGLTQAQFAEMIGTTQTTVFRYINGRWPSREAALAIEKATNGRVTAKDFLQVVPSKDGRKVSRAVR